MEAAVPPHKRLRASKVKPTTLKLYHNAVVEFEEWAADRALNLGSHKEIDEALVEFLHELCEDSRNISDANYTIFGYILLKSNFHMQDRDQLPFAKQAMKGWRARFPAKSRTGVDLRLWDLVALHCFRLGFIDSAAAILIQGDSYLRPNEVLSIRRDCVVPPSSSTLSEIWGVVICPFEEGVPTKSGEFDDTILFDTKERMDVNVIMKCLYRASRGHDYLFENLSYKDYVSHVKKASEHAGLGHLKLTPHVVRHSGASTDCFHKIRDFNEIQERGRWKCQRSVLRYKKPGRMLLQNNKVSSSLWKAAMSARSEVVPLLTSHFSSLV